MPKGIKGFQPGTGGRKPGSLNKTTDKIKSTIAKLVEDNLQTFNEKMEEISEGNPSEYAKLYLKLLEYYLPKSTNTTIDYSDNVISKINIQLKQPDGNQS
jgi:hypothetical protein